MQSRLADVCKFAFNLGNSSAMPQDTLERFGAYQKARALFDLVVADLMPLNTKPMCWRLISQQVASADSICANIEEGYGRSTRKDFALFLDYSRGSARETRGRYERLHHWLAADVVQNRVRLCDEIISILTRTISTLRTTPRQQP